MIVKQATFSARPIAADELKRLADPSPNLILVFAAPAWFPDGIELVHELVRLAFDREFFVRKMHLLDFARKKTTQKVNLYEKVQIPGFADAIRKIKRFLEDEDNLSKSAQKIVKERAKDAEAAG